MLKQCFQLKLAAHFRIQLTALKFESFVVKIECSLIEYRLRHVLDISTCVLHVVCC